VDYPYTYGASGIYLFFDAHPRKHARKIMPLGLGFLFPLTPLLISISYRVSFAN